MKRNKNIASFLFSASSAGMLSQALMSGASGTEILKVGKVVKEAKLQKMVVVPTMKYRIMETERKKFKILVQMIMTMLILQVWFT